MAPASRRATLHALQEWEGYVLETIGDESVARLVDLTGGSSYERAPSGTKKRVSQIVFRDLPRVTEQDLNRAGSGARNTIEALKL